MGCLQNLQKCKADCCRGFHLPIETQRVGTCFYIGNISADMNKYYELHEGIDFKDGWIGVDDNIEIEETEKLYNIKSKCKMLLSNLKCKIYYRNRPQICIDGYTKLKEGLWFPKNCIYEES